MRKLLIACVTIAGALGVLPAQAASSSCSTTVCAGITERTSFTQCGYAGSGEILCLAAYDVKGTGSSALPSALPVVPPGQVVTTAAMTSCTLTLKHGTSITTSTCATPSSTSPTNTWGGIDGSRGSNASAGISLPPPRPDFQHLSSGDCVTLATVLSATTTSQTTLPVAGVIDQAMATLTDSQSSTACVP
jgi:hypothetical protein